MKLLCAALLLALSGCGWETLPWTQKQVTANGRPCDLVGGDGFWLPGVYAMPDDHSKVCQ